LMPVLLALGEEAAAEQVARDLAVHARSLKRPFDLAYGLTWIALFELLRGNYPEAAAPAEQALGICRENGYPLYVLVSGSLRAHALGRLGRAAEMLPIAEGAVPAFRGIGMKHFSCHFLGEVAALQAIRGDFSTALASIDEAIAVSERYGEHYYLSPLHRCRAEILARHPDGTSEQVAAALDEAVAIALSQGAEGFARRALELKRSRSKSGPESRAAG
ncbi:MAG: hypothetical protein RIM80_28975, partial [Alphaproteobacteria bacterium]